MSRTGHRLIDHTADFGLEFWAPEPEELFSLAARVLFQNMVDSHGRLVGRHHHSHKFEGDDWSDLMVNWLRELLFLWHGQGRVLVSVTIDSLSATHLHATLTADDFNPDLHEVLQEIKAVTYHQIQVGPCEKGWCGRVIFDI